MALENEVAKLMLKIASEEWGIRVPEDARKLAERLGYPELTNLFATQVWLTTRWKQGDAGTPRGYVKALEAELKGAEPPADPRLYLRLPDRPGLRPARRGRRRYPRRR